MDKRYQAFVSSTYEDLQEERKEVIQALLELDCIPAGMELFPATDDDQWSLIKRVIDDCDYYIVVVGGRYGSIGPSGISYTEMEYRYALEKNKPIIAFLPKKPGQIPISKSDEDNDKKEKLDEFKSLCQKKMVKYWSSPADLGAVVSRSFIKLIRDHPAIGWVKADLLPSEETSNTIIQLHKRIDELEAEISFMKWKPPPDTENLSQGEDTFKVKYSVHAELRYFGGSFYINDSVDITWNGLFGEIAPILINEAKEDEIEDCINTLITKKEMIPIREKASIYIHDNYEDSDKRNYSFKATARIVDNSFRTILVQLRALGLIEASTKKRSVKDTEKYWMLTSYGDSIMNKLRAIKRAESE